MLPQNVPVQNVDRLPPDAPSTLFWRMKFPGNAVFPEMPCYQLFAIVTCPQVNVREATRGQAVQRKLPCSDLQGHICKNHCTRVFTSAMPRPRRQPFLPLPQAENGNYVAERDARPIWTKKDSRAKEPARPVERTELTPSRLFSPVRRNCSREALKRRFPEQLRAQVAFHAPPRTQCQNVFSTLADYAPIQ